jgi:hypothetical protein
MQIVGKLNLTRHKQQNGVHSYQCDNLSRLKKNPGYLNLNSQNKENTTNPMVENYYDSASSQE